MTDELQLEVARAKSAGERPATAAEVERPSLHRGRPRAEHARTPESVAVQHRSGGSRRFGDHARAGNHGTLGSRIRARRCANAFRSATTPARSRWSSSSWQTIRRTSKPRNAARIADRIGEYVFGQTGSDRPRSDDHRASDANEVALHRSPSRFHLVAGGRHISVEMLLDVSGMPRLDALRILHELVQQRIVAFR